MSQNLYDQLSQKKLLCSTFPEKYATITIVSSKFNVLFLFSVEMNKLLSKKQTIYVGFDPTGSSLHVGHLVVLNTVFHLLKHGHRVLIIIGDATARIGDPSGKLTERPVLAPETIEANVHGIIGDIQRVYSNFQKHIHKQSIADDRLVILRNKSWYEDKLVIEFIANYGPYLRMGDLLNKRAIKERLNSSAGLSFSEFSYQLFQAYDWLHLYRKYRCHFQLGGVDQLVNIHNGYDLIKKIENSPSYALLNSLVTDEKGNKIGKSEGKPVFINPALTTPYKFYQYFMCLRDVDISTYLTMFSFRSKPSLEELIQKQMKSPQPWYLQKKLAEEMTLLVHGEAGLESAKRITHALFTKDLNILSSLSTDELVSIFEGVPIFHLEFIPGNVSVLDLALRTECFGSTSKCLYLCFLCI